MTKSLQKSTHQKESRLLQSSYMKIYQSVISQSTLQKRIYDSQYKNGYPKLYALDTVKINQNQITYQDNNEKKKYSFKTQNSTRFQSKYYELLTQYQQLNQKYTTLSYQFQLYKKNVVNITEFERVNKILVSRSLQLEKLQQRIRFLQTSLSQSNKWQLKYQQSQTIIQNLNAQIISLNSGTKSITNVQYVSPIPKKQPLIDYSEKYKIEIDQLNQQLLGFKQQNKKLQMQLEEQNSRISTFQLQREQFLIFQQQNILLNQQIKELKSNLNLLQKQKQNLKQQFTNKQQQNNLNLNVTNTSQVTILNQQIEKYNVQITQLRQQVQYYHSQIYQYKSQIQYYQSQFSQYESVITSYKQRIVFLQNELKKNVKIPPSQGPNQIQRAKLRLRVIILLEQINRLKNVQSQLIIKSAQLHDFLLKAEDYIEQIQKQLQKNNLKENVPIHIVQKITRLQQQNVKYAHLIQELNKKIGGFSNGGISQYQHKQVIAKKDLKIIMLYQQINRLNEKVNQIRGYLETAEDYIEDLQRTLKNQQPGIPQEIQNQIFFLTEENNRLNLIIQSKITQINNLKVTISQKNSTVIERFDTNQINNVYKNSPQIEQQIVRLTHQNTLYIEQINRLTQNNEEIKSFLMNAQMYIQECQIKIRQFNNQQKINPQNQQQLTFLIQQNQKLKKLVIQLQNRPITIKTQQKDSNQLQLQIAKYIMKTIILLEQINRLNHLNEEVLSYLVKAQDYIGQCQTKITQFNQQFTQGFKVKTFSSQIESQLNLLNQQNDRLKKLVLSLQNKPVRVQTDIQQKNQHRVPANVQAKLIFYTQQIDRLNKLIRELQHRTMQVQTRIQKQIQYRVPIQIETQLRQLKEQNERFRIQIYQTNIQISQLTTNIKSIDSNVNVNLLTQQCGRLQLKTLILLQEINRLNFLTQQLKMHLMNAQSYIYEIENRPAAQVIQTIDSQVEINNLLSQNRRLNDQINGMTIRINNYKTEISTLNVEINNFRTQSVIYKSQPNHYAVKLAKIQQQKQQIMNYLLNAENYIRQLQIKYLQIQNSQNKYLSRTQTDLTQTSSNFTIEQVSQIQTPLRIQIGKRDLRIVILLQQINRLNHKQQQILELLGGSRTSISSHQELITLRREKQICQKQLQQVLSHLRMAQDYIGDLTRQNQQFINEKDQLIEELNRIQFRKK